MSATQSLKSTFTATGSGTAEALQGGYYFIAAAWANKSGATLNLQLLAPDGTTQLPLLGTAMSNSGVNAIGYLPAGQYCFIAAGTFGASEKITAALSSVLLD
jgi:hypothetical protein